MIRLLRALIPLVVAIAATLTIAFPAEAATITVSRTSVISGESVTVSGSVGGQRARRVILQQRSGGRWVNLKTMTSTRSGGFRFVQRITGSAGTTRMVRVTAPRAGSRRAVTTTSRSLRIVAQTGSLTAPANATTGVAFTVTAVFGPVRPGRTTVLQRFAGGTWTELARGKENSQGRTTFSPTLTPVGTALLRAVALASGGAAAKATAQRSVEVLPPVVQRLSEAADGTLGDGWSGAPSVSADGRYVAFLSSAANLVPGDTNGYADVFVRDRYTNAIERVSVGDGEQQSDQPSEWPTISADGRYVAFNTSAHLSTDPFSSATNVFVRDRQAGTTVKVSQPKAGDLIAIGGASWAPSISADGRYVAFTSTATNIVANDTNAVADVFVRDLVAGTTERASVDNDGNQSNGASGGARVSGDGQSVSYDSVATNLVVGDTNGTRDVFWWGRDNGGVHRVSQTSEAQGTGVSYASSISSDGRYVAFTSTSDELDGPGGVGSYGAFRWDLTNFTVERVSIGSSGQEATWDVYGPVLSSDGSLVAFVAYDPLVPEDTNQANDFYVRDIDAGTIRLASLTRSGGLANGGAANGAISGDGTTVAFGSDATNMTPDPDTNATRDVFSRDLTR